MTNEQKEKDNDPYALEISCTHCTTNMRDYDNQDD